MGYNTIKQRITGVYKPVKNAIINATANVMSAPAQIKAAKAAKQADSDVKILKTARAYDNAPDEANEGEAGMVRSLAVDVRDRLKKKK